MAIGSSLLTYARKGMLRTAGIIYQRPEDKAKRIIFTSAGFMVLLVLRRNHRMLSTLKGKPFDSNSCFRAKSIARSGRFDHKCVRKHSSVTETEKVLNTRHQFAAHSVHISLQSGPNKGCSKYLAGKAFKVVFHASQRLCSYTGP